MSSDQLEQLLEEEKLQMEEAKRVNKLQMMLDLANGIKTAQGVNGDHTLVDEILDNTRLEDYDEDDWNTKIDKLDKLRVTEKKRQIESIRYRNFASANGHLAANIFTFEIEDKEGKLIVFNCGTQSLKELRDAIVSIPKKTLSKILYKDEHGDIFILESDTDLIEAVKYARSTSWMKLKLHLEYSSSSTHGDSKVSLGFGSMDFADIKVVPAVLGVAGLGILAYLRRS